MNADTLQASEDKLKQALAISAPFADLSSTEHQDLLPHWKLSSFSKGDKVGLFDGQTDQGLWLIVSGEVELTTPAGA